MAMKYKVAVLALVILAALFMADGYRRTLRTEHKTVQLKSAVAAMSIQQLAQASKECDLARAAGSGAKPTEAYCAEVYRAIEDQPLQLVEPPK